MSAKNSKVTVTTRNAGETIIDGPTASTINTIKQIGTGQIAQDAIVPEVFFDASDGVFVGPQTEVSDIATCPLSHPIAVGGGPTVTLAAGWPFMHTTESSPQGVNQWDVIMYNSHPTDTFPFRAFAICMAPMP